MSAASGEAQRSLGKGRPGFLLATFMLGQMSQSLVFTAFMAALPQMAQDLGVRGPFIAQMTMALASLGLMIGCIVSGWVLEKMGTRTTLLASLTVVGVAGGIGLIAREPSVLLSSRFILGLASACMGTTCLWGIAAEYDGDRRARVLGVSAAVANSTALTATLLGGYIAQYGWPLTLIQYPLFAAVGFVLALASIRQVKPQAEGGGSSTPFFKRLLPFYLLVALMFVTMFMSSIQLAFIMEDDGIHSSATRSLYMGINTVAATVTSLCYGTLQRWLGVSGSFAFGAASMALALLIVGWGTQPLHLIVGIFFMGIYCGVLGPYIYHVVSEHTDSYSRGRAIGLLGAFGYLGGFLNPVVFAPLSDRIGLRNVYFLAAAVMALLTLGALALIVRQRATLRATPAS